VINKKDLSERDICTKYIIVNSILEPVAKRLFDGYYRYYRVAYCGGEPR